MRTSLSATTRPDTRAFPTSTDASTAPSNSGYCSMGIEPRNSRRGDDEAVRREGKILEPQEAALPGSFGARGGEIGRCIRILIADLDPAERTRLGKRLGYRRDLNALRHRFLKADTAIDGERR